MTEDEFDPLPADMMRARLTEAIEGERRYWHEVAVRPDDLATVLDTRRRLSLRSRVEYNAATHAEERLRAVVDTMPGWLYDASGIGSVVDDLNRARSDYERAHPEEEATRV